MRVSLWVLALALRLATLVVTLAAYIVIARLLGPAGSGRYFVFVSVVLLIAALTELGLSQSAIVFPARDPRGVWQIHRTLVKSSLILGTSGGAIALLVFVSAGERLLPSVPLDWMLLVCLAVPAALYASLWNGLAIGLTRLVSAGGVQLSVGALTLILNLLVLGVFGRREDAAVLIYVFSLLVQALFMLVLARRFAAKSPGEIRETLAREMLIFGVRGYLGGISTFLWMRLTIFLLNVFHGPAAVGLFSIGQQMAEKSLLPAHIIKEILYRDVASSDRAGAADQTNRCLRMTIATLAPITIAAAILAPTLMSMVFGSRFEGSADVVRVLFLGSAVMIIPTLLAPFFLGQLQRPGLLSVLAWANGFANALLAIWWIPALGALGAAWALLGSQLAGTVLVLLLYLRYSSTSLGRVIVPRQDDVALLWRRFAQLLPSGGTRL